MNNFINDNFSKKNHHFHERHKKLFKYMNTHEDLMKANFQTTSYYATYNGTLNYVIMWSSLSFFFFDKIRSEKTVTK